MKVAKIILFLALIAVIIIGLLTKDAIIGIRYIIAAMAAYYGFIKLIKNYKDEKHN